MSGRSRVWTWARLALLVSGAPVGYLAYASGPFPRQSSLGNTVDAVVVGASVSLLGLFCMLTRRGVFKPPRPPSRPEVLLRALAIVVITGLFSLTMAPWNNLWVHVVLPISIGVGIVATGFRDVSRREKGLPETRSVRYVSLWEG
ncbi:MAG: hypothetical protein M3Q23_11350 [Actinomycetota bacterium]|nr:hypothetical protein [Actinomycetota bacterium]